MRLILRMLAGALVGALLLLVGSITLLRWIPPVTSAFMLEASLNALRAGDDGYHTDYRWAGLEAISPQAALAVIAHEDQNFPFHAGFDLPSIRAAVRAHERGARLRGASTISQQVAKNLFLSSSRSFARKGIEAALTVLIEALWPKERILEVYLNIAQFGRGIYGVEAAAHRFFHEGARRLTAEQSALLAASLPNPERLRVDAPSRYLLSERDRVLRQMSNLGGPMYLNDIKPSARATANQR